MAEEKKIADLNLRELRDKGMKVVAQMEDLGKKRNAEGKMTPDDERQFELWDEECNAIDKEIRLKERKEHYEAEEARRGPKIKGTDTESDEKFDPKFMPTQRRVNETLQKFEQRERKSKYMNEEERKILTLLDQEEKAFEKFFRCGLNMNNDSLDAETRAIIQNLERRTQSTTTTAGGYTIPQGFIPKIITQLKYISVFFQEMQYPNTGGGVVDDVFDVYRTDMGNDLPVPTNDDTANVGELLTENSDASSSSADLVFGQKVFKAYKFSTKMIKSSNELLQDTGVDIPGHIAKQFATRLGRVLNTYFTIGTNSSQPQGITNGLTAGKVAGTSGALSFPEIIDLVHSVDVSYRNSPAARFMLHDKILAIVKKATVGAATTNSRPLWAPGWDVAAPPTIDGHQYLINNDMDSTIASGKKIILFGDMKSFGVRWVNQLRLLRLAERYAEFDQVAWVGFMRADSKQLNPAGTAIKYYAGT